MLTYPDWPHPIQYIAVTPGNKMAASGAITLEQEAEPVLIKGNLLTNPVEGQERGTGGVIKEGEAVFVTTHDMTENDIIVAWMDDAGNKKLKYRVKPLIVAYARHAKKHGSLRRKWRLVLEGDA